MEEHDEESEWLHDEITGRKKSGMGLLNKQKLSKYEMDEFFVE